jgi:hypothetical protein
MVTVRVLETQILGHPERDRANLASVLLSSLPPACEEDDGVEEALRREVEMETDPTLGMSLAEFEQEFSGYRTV